ncbi:MAG: hypothetical protein ACYC3I_25090, partial [Gemmataceae bacterium]
KEYRILRYAKWRKALNARKPTPEHERLVNLWRRIEDALNGFETIECAHSSDTDAELLHVSVENGQVWLTVTEHRKVDIPLDELFTDKKQVAQIKEEIGQLASKKARKQGSRHCKRA